MSEKKDIWKALFDKGRERAANEAWEEAVSNFLAAGEVLEEMDELISPELGFTLFELGSAWSSLKKYAEAESSLHQSLETFGELPEKAEYAEAMVAIKQALAEMKWEQGDYEGAERAFRALLQFLEPREGSLPRMMPVYLPYT